MISVVYLTAGEAITALDVFPRRQNVRESVFMNRDWPTPKRSQTQNRILFLAMQATYFLSRGFETKPFVQAVVYAFAHLGLVGLRLCLLTLRSRRAWLDNQIQKAINVKMGHVSIWREVLDAGTSHALILESDAKLLKRDERTFEQALNRLVETPGPYIAFLSDSFSFEDFGMRKGSFTLCERLDGQTQIQLASPGIANTTCAYFVTRDALIELIDFHETSMGTSREIMPVDWLMDCLFWQKSKKLKSFHLSPGCFQHLSNFRNLGV